METWKSWRSSSRKASFSLPSSPVWPVWTIRNSPSYCWVTSTSHQRQTMIDHDHDWPLGIQEPQTTGIAHQVWRTDWKHSPAHVNFRDSPAIAVSFVDWGLLSAMIQGQATESWRILFSWETQWRSFFRNHETWSSTAKPALFAIINHTDFKQINKHGHSFQHQLLRFVSLFAIINYYKPV